MDDLFKTFKISASGMKSQGTRLRVISENIANADSLPQSPGGTPYRRKTITFRTALDKSVGADLVEVNKIGTDRGEFVKKFDPNHPGADSDGYVLTPNVNPLIEMMDMREAERSYEANLNVIRSSRSMMQSAIDLLR
jgi:flagellar basal-body rod protein FlgC